MIAFFLIFPFKWPKHQYAKQHNASMTENLIKILKDNLEYWTGGLVSHYVDIFQIDSSISILLYNIDKEKVIIGG